MSGSLIPRLSQDERQKNQRSMPLTIGFFCIPTAPVMVARKSSTGGQKLGGIDGFALAANFKMQFDPIGIGFTHLGDLLPPSHLLVFLDQQALVVGVCGQKSVVVLEDDQVAVSAQTCTRIDHLAICSRQDGITGLTRDVQAFVFDFVKRANDGSVGWPRKRKARVIGSRRGRAG
jgi:hypothetical protein